jgi:WD40 repeat protein
MWGDAQGWVCSQIFEGHSHYVMQVAFNPKDTNTFASASLDRTIKVWSIGQPTPNFTLEGHEKGVNCVDYFNGGLSFLLGICVYQLPYSCWSPANLKCVPPFSRCDLHV